MTIVLRSDVKGVAKDIDNKQVMVTGTIIDYKGKPEIIVTEAKQLSIVPVLGENSFNGQNGGE